MDPCPNCGHTTSLKDLRDELENARMIKRRQEAERRAAAKRMTFGDIDLLGCNTLNVGGSMSLELTDPYEVCAGCGMAWRPDFAAERERLRTEIIETQGVIEALGSLHEGGP